MCQNIKTLAFAIVLTLFTSLATPLAAKCSTPFTPAMFDAGGNLVTPATARCCASALTLAEFKSLEDKMDARDDR